MPSLRVQSLFDPSVFDWLEDTCSLVSCVFGLIFRPTAFVNPGFLWRHFADHFRQDFVVLGQLLKGGGRLLGQICRHDLSPKVLALHLLQYDGPIDLGNQQAESGVIWLQLLG